MKDANVLVLLSGGVDSTACLHYYLSLDYSVSALFVDYGQDASTLEFNAAHEISNYYNIELATLHLTTSVPKDGYIPARNALLVCLGLMEHTEPHGLIGIGIHAGVPYADCTRYFRDRMQDIVDIYTLGAIQIDAPFIDWTKHEIWDYAQLAGVPLSLTHTSNPDSLPSSRRNTE